MSTELSIKFENTKWYKDNKSEIHNIISKLSSYRKNIEYNEFWLKDVESKNPWDFDLRIFLNMEEIYIEVSSFTDAFHRDIKTLVNDISTRTKIYLLDDGEPFIFD